MIRLEWTECPDCHEGWQTPEPKERNRLCDRFQRKSPIGRCELGAVLIPSKLIDDILKGIGGRE